jgi:hypothetical protein
MMNIRIEQRSLALLVSNASQAAPVSRDFGSARLKFYVSTALAFLTSVAATIYLCRSMPGGMPMPGGWTMSMAWMRMPGKNWLGSGASFIAMWIVMMVAMMLPSLVPMLVSYQRSMNRWGTARCSRLTMLASAGYFMVWTIIGLAVYLGHAMDSPRAICPCNVRRRFDACGVPATYGVENAPTGALPVRSSLQSAVFSRHLERRPARRLLRNAMHPVLL